MNQKKIIWAFFLLLGTGLMFTSCKKDKEEEVKDEELTVSDEAIDDELEYTVGGLAYSESENFYSRSLKPQCGTVTVSGNTFPLTVTVDFGDGCEGPKGKMLKGKIIVEFSDSMKVEDAERTITFENYSVDDNKIDGFRKFKNLGKNNNGNPEFSIESDIKFETAAGKKLHRKHSGKREWTKGHDTYKKRDDEFLISGEGSLVRPDGTTVTRTIKTPVHIAVDCKYPMAGVVELKGASKEASINFGNGECDEKATITNSSGTIIEIDLSKWKRRKPL